jgi:flagellar biogenesis protein FliO
MNFRYYEQDEMDKVPAPAEKMALSMIAIVALFLALLYGAAAILGN